MAAIVNIVLNFVFIKKYGYIAAAYTTLATYFLYFLLHYLIAIKVEGKILFSNKVMLRCSAGIFSAVILGNVLIDHIILRILVVLLLCGAGLIHEEKTLGILKRLWRSNR